MVRQGTSPCPTLAVAAGRAPGRSTGEVARLFAVLRRAHQDPALHRRCGREVRDSLEATADAPGVVALSLIRAGDRWGRSGPLALGTCVRSSHLNRMGRRAVCLSAAGPIVGADAAGVACAAC